MREHSTPNNSQLDMDDQHEDVRNLQNDLDYLEQQYKQVSKENILLKEEFQVLQESKASYQHDLDEIKLKVRLSFFCGDKSSADNINPILMCDIRYVVPIRNFLNK